MRELKKKKIVLIVFLVIAVCLCGCSQSGQVLPSESEVLWEQEKLIETETLAAEISKLEVPVTKETAPQYSQTDELVYVTANQVNLRTAGNLRAEIITRLNKGTELRRTGYHENWSKVIYQDKEYYISSSYLSAERPAMAAAIPKVEGNGAGKIIAIDAGHQAKGMTEKEPNGPGSSVMKAKLTSGTTGVSTGLAEYQLNLAVSLKLKQELLSRGYQVYMVRETHDVTLSNVDRALMANDSGADIFIRVHANSVNDSNVRGALTMCMTPNNPYYPNLYPNSSRLSKLVTNGICDTTGFKNKGVQETDTMTGINWCSIPTTIVEMGFMSNPEEDRLMATDEYQEKIAKGIADGIDAYYTN